MTYRSIFVHVDDSSRSDLRLDAAMRLARRYPADVLGTYLVSRHELSASEIALLPPDFVRARDASVMQAVRDAEARFRSAMKTGGIGTSHWLVPAGDPAEFALDAERVQKLVAELGPGAGPGSTRRWSIALAALQTTRIAGLDTRSPNADLNARIAAAVVSSLPPTLFDGAGVPRALWLARMYAVSDDAQQRLTQLTYEEQPAPPQDSPLGALRRADGPQVRWPRFRP